MTLDPLWMPFIAAIIAAIIAAAPPTVVGYFSLRHSRRNGGAIKEVRISLNHRLDELLKLTGTEAHAAGMLEGGGNLRQMEAHAAGLSQGAQETAALLGLIERTVARAVDQKLTERGVTLP